jgi:type II secretory pathway pseudopilin PulG
MPSFQLIRNRDNKAHSTEQSAAAATATLSSHKKQTQQNQSLPRRNKPPPPPGVPKDRLNIPSNLFQLDQQPKAESNDDTSSNDSTSSYQVVQAIQQVSPSAVVVTPSKNVNHHTETTLPSAMATQSISTNNDVIAVDRNRITRVDGKGLWRSWKRNFNSQVSLLFLSIYFMNRITYNKSLSF